MSLLKMFNSNDVNSSFNFEYFFTFSAWLSNFIKSLARSFVKSGTLLKLICALSSCLILSSFFFVYLPIPAASSNIFLLSSGFASPNQITAPCEMIPRDPLDNPVSKNISWICFNLDSSPLIEYLLVPLPLWSHLVTLISFLSEYKIF